MCESITPYEMLCQKSQNIITRSDNYIKCIIAFLLKFIYKTVYPIKISIYYLNNI